MTYREICDRLASAGIESAAWDAECLIRRYFSVGRASLFSDPQREYNGKEFLSALEKRCRREPLQYLLGEWEFYRQTYEVSPDCLIPRSDTEVLVEEAIRRLPPNAQFADLCTGSGCIAVSVLAERRDTRAYALEKFPATLALAERNAERNGVRDRFTPMLSDVLTPSPALSAGSLDAILSNPPYIASGVIPTLSPEVLQEPRAALDGGEDGLVFYRAILSSYAPCLTPTGFFLFEIGYDQGDALVSLGREHGFSHIEVIRDLGGCDRVVYLASPTLRKDGTT